ncbi:hypothetical protein E0W60_36320 (plasmid) [Cupriavidus oxalaticus]|uniref:Uncharacterized protein n=1 Tax=Cupriavidus oxalaticus TaxID=96344 RepID=A0A4V1BZT6_9BURK|nr:hypothetical protein E0W60_36320 [Cupriavidus oxalaticus]
MHLAEVKALLSRLQRKMVAAQIAFSDGGDTVRYAQIGFGDRGEYVLEWFHIANADTEPRTDDQGPAGTLRRPQQRGIEQGTA